MKSSRVSPGLVIFTWLFVLVLLVPDVALAAGYIPNAPSVPAASPSPWDAFAQDGPTTVEELAREAMETPLTPLVTGAGRLLFAPTIDNDGNPATNPVAGAAVPVIDLMGDKGGFIFLAAQLMPDDPDQAPIGLPVTFHVWSDRGYDHREPARSDAWGAAGMRLLPRDIEATYYYQASAPGYGQTEVRSFRFNPAEASYILHADGAELWYWQGAERTVFTVRSPRPLVEGRDAPMLTIARRPEMGSSAEIGESPVNGGEEEETFTQIYQTLSNHGAGIPLPTLPMRIVDEYTAQVEVQLPAGSYGAIASLAIDGEPAEHFYSEPVLLDVEEEPAAPEGIAIWASELEYEPGRTLVQYQADKGTAVFALLPSDSLPPISPAWLEESTFLRTWRTGPFEWQEEVYNVSMDVLVDDGLKKVSLAGFDYDPMLRRYTIAIQSLQDHPVSDTLRVDVYGPGGIVIHHIDAQVVLRPDELLIYEIDVPAELGQPTGLRVALDDPIDAIINAISAAGQSLADIVSTYGNFELTFSFVVDALGVKILEIKMVMRIPPGTIEVSDPLNWWFPDGSDTWTLLDKVKDWALNGAWDWDNMILDIGGATWEMKFSLGLNLTVDDGACPDAESRDDMARTLSQLANTLNVGLERLKENRPAGDADDESGITVPLFWFLQLFARLPNPNFGGAANADGLTLRFSVDFTVKIGLRLAVDLWPFNIPHFEDKIKALYHGVLLIQGIYQLVSKQKEIKNWQLHQANCNPSEPDPLPPDDRQDVWQTLDRLYRGDTPEQSLAQLSQWLASADTQNLARAATYVKLQMRRTELFAFSSDTAAFDAYIGQLAVIAEAATVDQQAIVSGTLPISPTQTITEAVLARGEQAYLEMQGLPYVQQQRQLLDAVAVAERDFNELFGEELELQHEIQQMLFGNSAGIVASGFTYATESTLATAGLPYQYVNLWPGGDGHYQGKFAPYVAPEIAPRLLVVPSGGLHSIANSSAATAWLDEYVATGGLLVVFTQAFGEDWNALPGGEVRGVGYNEDQRCQQASVRAAMPSDWLVWMGVPYPDIQVDGAFTAWPANANVLLVRTYGNFPNYPAMIEYEYGSGRVLATTAYGDWAESTGIGWGDDWQMTRTVLLRAYLLSQGQDLDDVTAVPPYTWYNPTISLTNSSALTTTEVLVRIPTFTGKASAYGGDTVTATLELGPGQTTVISPSLRTPTLRRNIHDWTRIGLYRLRVNTTTADGLVHQGWGPYLLVTGGTPPPEMSVLLTASQVAANPFDVVTVTATIRNFTAVSRPITLLAQGDLAGEAPFVATVPPGGTVQHNYQLTVYSSLEPAVALQDNNTSELIDESRMLIHLAEPSAQMGLALPSVVESGTPLDVVVFNEPVYQWQQAAKIVSGTVELDLYAPGGVLRWSQSQPLPIMGPGEIYTATFAAASVAPVALGNYRFTYRVRDYTGRLIGEGATLLPATVSLDGEFDRPSYRIRETVTFTGTILNSGRLDLAPNVEMTMPPLAVSSNPSVNLPVEEAASIPFSFTLPPTMTAGIYTVTVAATQNSNPIVRRFTFAIPPAHITADLVAGAYAAGGHLPVHLTNSGGQDATTDYQFWLSDRNGQVIATQADSAISLQAGQTITVLLPIPAGAASGVYRLLLAGQVVETGQRYDLLRLPAISGIEAAVSVATDQLNYTAGEEVSVSGVVTAVQNTVSGTLALSVRQAGLGNVEMVTAGGPIEVVNDNDEPGFLDQDAVDVIMDDDGNVYAIWERFTTADIVFNMKPAGGSWGTPEAINDSRYYGRDDPKLALGSDGTIYAIWWDNRDLDYEGTNIYYAQRSPDGTWTPNEQVNEFPGWEYAYDPDIAVDGAGNLYAVYYDDREGNDTDIIFAMKPAGGDWTTGVPVTDASAGGFVLDPSIAVDSSGNAHLIWHDDRNYPLYELYYAYRPAGGSWSTPEKINTAGNAWQYSSEIVLLPTDEPAVVWQDNRSGNYDVYFAYRPAGGPWSANEPVSDANSAAQDWPDMGVDAAGNVYVAWGDRRGGGYHIYFDWRNNAGGWSGDTLVSDDSTAVKGEPALAANNSGAVYVAWEDNRPTTGTSNNGEIYGAARPVGGPWGGNERVSLGGGGARQQVPAISYDSNGRPIILWADTRLRWGVSEIYYDVRDSGWQTDTRVNDDTPATYAHGVPAVAADANGKAYAVWADQRSGNYDVYFSIYNGATWDANSRLNDITTGTQTQPVIAATAGGELYALWSDNRSGNYDIYFSYRPAGGAWSASQKVNNDLGTTIQFAPDIALDAAGNAYAVWHDGRNGNYDIYFNYRPAGGSWGANQRINDDAGTALQTEPALFVTPAGDAYVTWTDMRNGPEELYFAMRPAGGSWTPNEKIHLDTLTTHRRWSDLVVDGDGNVFVVWSHFSAPRNVYLSVRQDGVWGAPIQLNNGQGATAVPVIAISPSGEIGVAFEDDGLWLAQDIHFTTLQTALRPLAGPWSGEQRVEDDPAGAGWQWSPDLAADGLGNRYAVWHDERNGNVEVWFARQEPGGSWSANEPVSDGSSDDEYDPAIAVDPYGNAFAVWSDYRNGHADIYFANRPLSATWGVNEKVNDDSGVAGHWVPDMIVDAAGNAYVAWDDRRNGNGDIYYSYRPAGGSWSANVRINDDTGTMHQSDPNLALDAAGNVYAVWDDARNGSGFDNWDIYFAMKTAGGSWGLNERVSDDASGAEQWYPRLVVDAAGNAYATWMDDRDGNWNIYFAYRPAGGSWSANQRVNDDAGTATQMMPAMVIDAAGYVTIAWTDFREGQWHVYAARRAPDGQWSRNRRVNSGGTTDGNYYRLGLAAHSSGDVTAIWGDLRNGSAHDLYGATMDIGAETTLWQEAFAIHTNTVQSEGSNAGTLHERPGKYWLVGELTSALEQRLGDDRRPFYIYPAGLAFTLDLSDPIIAPGQSVTASGRVTNTSLLADTFVLQVYAGTEQVLSQTLSLSAGQGVAYNVNFSPDTSRPVQAIVNGAAVADWLDVVEPQVTAVLTAPLVAGVEPLTATVTLTNTGLVPAALNVTVGNGPAQPVSLEPGAVALVQQAITIDSTRVLSAVVSGDANRTLSRTVQFAAGALLTWQPPADPLAGRLDAGYLISGTGSLPAPVHLLVSLDGSAILSRSLTVLPGQALSGTVTISTTAGSHLLSGQLLGSGGQLLDEAAATLGVAPAGQPNEAQITILEVAVSPAGERLSGRDPLTSIPAGQPFDVSVTVGNDGPAAPIIVAVQVFNDVQQWVITPTAYLTQSYTFSQSMPADIPAGEYVGRLVAGNAEQSFLVAVSGADVELALALDQPDYLAGQIVSLTATLTEQAGAAGLYRLALHTPGDEAYVTVTVPANTAVQHTFIFTATEGGRASVALSYAGGGPADGQRTIMIDSLPLRVADPAQKATVTFDQIIYDAGDTIWFNVNVNGLVGNLAVIGPMELFRDGALFDWNAPAAENAPGSIVTGTHSLSYTLPAALPSGAYTFLLMADGRTYPYAVDVRGWSVNARHTSLDRLRYDQSDSLEATVEFLNNGPTAIHGLHLRAWVAPADGSDLLSFSPAVSRTVSLQPGLNVFTVTGVFDSPAAGPHRLLVNLMAPDWSWRVAGAVAQFDVGAAFPVELATDHGSYALNQPGSGRLTLYGYGPTQVVVTATNGATLVNTTLEPAGYHSLTFAVPTDSYGDYLLLANVTGDDGSQGQLVRAYNVPTPRDTAVPLLTLTDPLTRTVITGTAPAAITVTGQVSDDGGAVTLLVNGEVVTPTAGGQFTATLPLTRGVNLVSAVALDAAGNVSFSPLLPVYLVPETNAVMSAAAYSVTVNTSLTFEVVLTSADQADNVLYTQLLPTEQITNVMVTASSGEAVVSQLFAGSHTINWRGVLSPTQPVTLQITGRPILTGTLTGTATLFWGWGIIEDTPPVAVQILADDPTAIRLNHLSATPPTQRNRFLWLILLLLLVSCVRLGWRPPPKPRRFWKPPGSVV